MTHFNALMTEHLDLPWRVQYSPACYSVETASGSTVVDLDYDDTDPLEAEGARVSAYLIAGAPEMYQALREIAGYNFPNHPTEDYENQLSAAVGIARAAIAKAEGQ